MSTLVIEQPIRWQNLMESKSILISIFLPYYHEWLSATCGLQEAQEFLHHCKNNNNNNHVMIIKWLTYLNLMRVLPIRAQLAFDLIDCDTY